MRVAGKKRGAEAVAIRLGIELRRERLDTGSRRDVPNLSRVLRNCTSDAIVRRKDNRTDSSCVTIKVKVIHFFKIRSALRIVSGRKGETGI
jgi:hypothetical protein